jgi:ribonuclease-3
VDLLKGPRSPRKPGVQNLRNPLADAMEAILAAVFLDAGGSGGSGLARVLELVETRFMGEIRRAYVGVWESRDSKTTLQEKAATLALPPPAYELVERAGPDHAPLFTVRATLGVRDAVATAGTLKGAQAEAARALLKLLDSGKEGPGLTSPPS